MRPVWWFPAVILLMSAEVKAEDADPDTCICLRHSSGQTQRGSRAEIFPGQYYRTGICTDPEYPDQTAKILITSAWTEIAEGETGCEVCRPEAREGKIVPRGDDQELE